MNKLLLNRLAIALLFFALPLVTFANVDDQATAPKDKPDYAMLTEEDEFPANMPFNYITFVADWGITYFVNATDHMDNKSFFNSRAGQGMLYYNIPIKKSHFMVNCGLGLSSSTYALAKDYTLGRSTKRATEILPIASATNIKSTGDKLKSSTLDFKTAKIGIEFRFNSNKEEPQDGFFVSVGGSIGLNFSPSTTIRYEEDKEVKEQKLHESFNLNKVHYGIIARTGWSRYGAFYQQTFSPLFSADKGPNQENAFPFWIGVSVNLF